MKYKKKPVIIDAVQWTGKNHREMFDFLTQDTFKEESMQVSGDHFYIDHNKVEGGLIIKTLEGEHLATIGDYIIRGVQGEYYPCKEDIFHQTYEIYSTGKLTINDNGYWGNGVITIPCTEKVPYHTICSCNPSNGGSGICGCTMANELCNPQLNISTNSHTTFLSHEPEPNEVPCPKCGKEMMDTYPNIILTSNPAQKNVHCPSCDYVGYRTV